jgi:hypothetical protein
MLYMNPLPGVASKPVFFNASTKILKFAGSAFAMSTIDFKGVLFWVSLYKKTS